MFALFNNRCVAITFNKISAFKISGMNLELLNKKNIAMRKHSDLDFHLNYLYIL